jgi:ribosomal protein L29
LGLDSRERKIMELHKLSYEDALKLGAEDLKQTEKALRLELNMRKLDVYGIKGKKSPAKGLRKSLARVLTAKKQNKKSLVK